MLVRPQGFLLSTLIVSETPQPSAQSTPIPSLSVQDLQQKLAEAEQVAEQHRCALQATQQELQVTKLKVQLLEERLRQKRIEKYGPHSEKLSTLQLELLEEEPGVSDQEVKAESERGPLRRRARRKHPGRQSLPQHLPRVEKVIACTPEQCVCSQCGGPTTVIGYDESEPLAVEPAKYYVSVVKREKRACKGCEEQGVVAAPLPLRIIEKSLASDMVVVDTVIRKYADHCVSRRRWLVERRRTVQEMRVGPSMA